MYENHLAKMKIILSTECSLLIIKIIHTCTAQFVCQTLLYNSFGHSLINSLSPHSNPLRWMPLGNLLRVAYMHQYLLPFPEDVHICITALTSGVTIGSSG